MDYHETFAPVVRHSTIRIVLALAVQFELLVHHIDIVAAYLNGDLEDDVYMWQPPMFQDPKNKEKMVYVWQEQFYKNEMVMGAKLMKSSIKA